MAKRGNVVRIIARELGLPFVTNKSVVYVPFFRYSARGVFIEGTPYKDTLQLRRFLLPFFDECDFVHVTYSPRLKSEANDYKDHFVGNDRQIAEWMLRRIDELGLRDEAVTEFDPAQFLKAFPIGDPGEQQPFRVIDASACMALIGETTAADEALGICERDVIGFKNSAERDRLLEEIRGLRSILQRGGAAVESHLMRVCHDNAIALGFRPMPLPLSADGQRRTSFDGII